MPDIRVEREGGVAVLTIDRPQARNAIGLNTMAELDAALAELDGEDIHCAVITGAGDRAFVAGGDLRELESVTSEDFAADMAVRMRRTLDRIAALPIPVIAAVNGAAVGGGLAYALHCDIRIASEQARFGSVFIKAGFSFWLSLPCAMAFWKMVGLLVRPVTLSSSM